MKILNLKPVIFLLLLLLPASCTYQFESGGLINGDISGVAVHIIDNDTQEKGAGFALTNAFIQEIMGKTDTTVVKDRGSDAVLKGKINSITFAAVSRSTTESVLERRVTANVDMQLIDSSGEIIWAVNDFTCSEAYLISESKLEDESNKKAAVDKISKRIAERLTSRMLNKF